MTSPPLSKEPIIDKLLSPIELAEDDLAKLKTLLTRDIPGILHIGRMLSPDIETSFHRANFPNLLPKIDERVKELSLCKNDMFITIMKAGFALSRQENERDEDLIWQCRKDWSGIRRKLLIIQMQADHDYLEVFRFIWRDLLARGKANPRNPFWGKFRRTVIDEIETKNRGKYGTAWDNFEKEKRG